MQAQGSLFYNCLLATIQTTIISTVGFLIFKTKVKKCITELTIFLQMITSSGLSTMSRLVEDVFTPAIIFYNFIQIDLFAVSTWLPVCILSIGKYYYYILYPKYKHSL